MANSGKWIIVSNRLPFSWNAQESKLEPSSGGLVTAISGIRSEHRSLWVGGVPEDVDTAQLNKRTKQYRAVSVPAKLYEPYYNGMCNNVLWPLLHYESELVQYSEKYWKAYQEVNRLFADAILDVAEDGDLIWVHDFHLFLVPKLLKSKRRNLRVGHFLHVPFPSSEVFRQLPIRKEILEAVLSSDLIGFHDYSYLRHFVSAVYTVLGVDSSMLSVRREGHTAHLGVFPVSIDTGRYQEQAASAEVKKIAKQFSQKPAREKLILGVDRLDYIKGIELKLKAFQEMLRAHPETQGKVALLQVAIPSRTDVADYIQLKHQIEQLVGEINGQFGSPTYVPVQYMFTSVDFNSLLALYRLADVLLVTSKRDGMNLVALEYIAAQQATDPGVVVLSEFAGAVSTLSHVIRTNPWDIKQTANCTYAALTMERDERVSRNSAMMRYLETYTATDWASSFMEHLKNSSAGDSIDRAELVSVKELNASSPLLQQFKGQDLLILCDYDGTLVPIVQEPQLAVLTESTKDLIRKLLVSGRVRLVIVSGRDARFLERQFEGLPLTMAAEHGALYYNPELGKWKTLVTEDRQGWLNIARQVMNDYTVRVPESFIEKKQFALAWHYRKSPRDFGSYQARRLKNDLEAALANLPVSILAGKKVVEVRVAQANKAAFYRWYRTNYAADAERKLLVFGDDVTDEEMFASVGNDGARFKVGEGETVADYRLERQEDVLQLLLKLATAG